MIKWMQHVTEKNEYSKHMKSLFFIIFVTMCQSLFCQVTFIIDSLPANHNSENDIFISGDFEGWSGGKEDFRLVKNNSKYLITIPKNRETIRFKFTLGSWNSVECQHNNSPIENRIYSFQNVQDSVHVNINNWSTNIQEKKSSTASKNVHVFSENFKMPQLNRERIISVYLPPNYEASKTKYPVLYMHDGQNVFDLARSNAGEWEVDETLNKLSIEKDFNVIVVAIDNGNDNRLSEYSPWSNPKYAIGEGDAYLDFLVNTLKPEIDKKYRTKKSATNTAIMGSSMGGLISHYAALKYPNVFGKVGVFSPAFWYSNESFEFSEKHANLKNTKMYFLVGDNESGGMVEDVEKMVNIMKENDFLENNIYTKIVPKGTHSETFWKSEFESAILWLFSK